MQCFMSSFYFIFSYFSSNMRNAWKYSSYILWASRNPLQSILADEAIHCSVRRRGKLIFLKCDWWKFFSLLQRWDSGFTCYQIYKFFHRFRTVKKFKIIVYSKLSRAGEYKIHSIIRGIFFFNNDLDYYLIQSSNKRKYNKLWRNKKKSTNYAIKYIYLFI